jgi:hypothetical protein
MAFQSGSQVNAALGRTDFTPFLQGAMQGAQAQGRAGELIGQGLAGLGQQVATGVEKYYKKEEEKQLNEQAAETVSRILKTNPAFASQVGLKPDASGNIDRKAIGAVVKSLGGAANTIQFANTLNEFTRKQAEDTQAAQYASAVTNAGGRPFSMVNQVSPTAQFRGAEMAAELAKTKSETAENLREKAGASGRVMTQEEVAAIPAGTDYKGTPLPDGTIFVTGLSRSSPSATTNINMGENAYKKRGGEVLFDRDLSEYDAASAAPDRIQKLDDVLGIINSGDLTTGFGAELFQNANRIKAKFMNDEKAGKTVSNTEILDSLLGSDVFPMITALGVGARGMDTPAEREFLRQSFTGTKEFSPETLKRLTEIRRDIELRTVKKYKDNYEKGTYKRFFEESGRQVPDFNSIPPKGVTSLQWSVMTPEQKALFQE